MRTLGARMLRGPNIGETLVATGKRNFCYVVQRVFEGIEYGPIVRAQVEVEPPWRSYRGVRDEGWIT